MPIVKSSKFIAELQIFPKTMSFNNSSNIISKDQKYFKMLFWIIIIFLLIVTIYLLNRPPRSILFSNSIWALAITWLGFFPTLQYLADPNRPPIPFFPMVGVYYAIAYGLPMFAADFATHYRFPLTNVSSESLALAFLGIGGMNFGFFVSQYWLFKNVSYLRIPAPFLLKKLLILAWILMLGHIANVIFPFINKIPSVSQFLEPSVYISGGIFYILWVRGLLPQSNLPPLLFVLTIILIIRIATGALFPVMWLLLFLYIIIWRETKRIPVIMICFALLLVLVLNPLKSEYRKLSNQGGIAVRSVEQSIEGAKLLLQLTLNQSSINKTKDFSQKFNENIASVVDRVGYINVFSQVIKDTPARVPYWGGQTYIPLFTKFIPRFLWPDKPQETVGNQFGRRYRYFGNINDFSTSFRLPWLIEMYANFGSIGVLIGMPIAGLFLGFLNKKFNNLNMNLIEFLIGNTVLINMIYQEANFSLMVGSSLLLPLSFYLLFRFCLSNSSSIKVPNKLRFYR